jgi:DNA-binding transcriptional LysR family regulator
MISVQATSVAQGEKVHLIDIDQLKTLMAIADAGSFTKAADQVFKTQSAVSMQMKRLEEHVGRAVFMKDGRGVRFTEDGHRLLDYARRIVRLSQEAVTSFADEKLTGRVRLGVPDDYADRYLPDILASFTKANPRVEVTVICEPTPTLLDCVDECAIDLAIITHAQNRRVGEIIRHEPLLWVTSARHHVEQEEVVPLALGRPTCAWRRAAIERLENVGRAHRVLYASWNSSAVGAAVLAGLAVGVLPESAVRQGMRILTAQDGFTPMPTVKIGLVRGRAENVMLADALAHHIRESLANIPQGEVDPVLIAAE